MQRLRAGRVCVSGAGLFAVARPQAPSTHVPPRGLRGPRQFRAADGRSVQLGVRLYRSTLPFPLSHETVDLGFRDASWGYP